MTLSSTQLPCTPAGIHPGMSMTATGYLAMSDALRMKSSPRILPRSPTKRRTMRLTPTAEALREPSSAWCSTPAPLSATIKISLPSVAPSAAHLRYPRDAAPPSRDARPLSPVMKRTSRSRSCRPTLAASGGSSCFTNTGWSLGPGIRQPATSAWRPGSATPHVIVPPHHGGERANVDLPQHLPLLPPTAEAALGCRHGLDET
jgi:hypothetical protein